jgi:hypothetical protein
MASMLIAQQIAVQVFGLISRRGILRQVTDDEIKLVEVVTAQGFLSIAGHDSLVAQAAERVFEYGTQLIVIVDDENPTFLHPTPIFR